MNSTRDYTPDARKANHLRNIIDRLKEWEAKKVKRPRLTIYADDYGNIKNVREEKEI